MWERNGIVREKNVESVFDFLCQRESLRAAMAWHHVTSFPHVPRPAKAIKTTNRITDDGIEGMGREDSVWDGKAALYWGI